MKIYNLSIIIIIISLIEINCQRRRPSSVQDDYDEESIDDYKVKSNKQNNKILSIIDYLKDSEPLDNIDSNHILNKEKIKPIDILNNHHYYNPNLCEKAYNSEVFAFVTPWNKKIGYQISTLLTNKLQWISPVWFEVILGDKGLPVISGYNNIDFDWIINIKNISNSCNINSSNTCINEDSCFDNKINIVPRLLLSSNIINSGNIDQISSKLIELASNYNFSGYTIEQRNAPESFRLLSKMLKKRRLKVVMVLSYISLNHNDAESFKFITSYSDRLLFMSYDYSQSRPDVDLSKRFNAPYPWIESSIQSILQIDSNLASKLMIGLPMYGWKNEEAMIGQTMIIWLAKHSESIDILWDKNAKEHLFIYKDNNNIKEVSSYPTSLFITKRLELSLKYKLAGVFLWEIGQMMTYFIDLF